MKKENLTLGIAIIALFMGFMGLVSNKPETSVGGTTNFDDLTLSGVLTTATGVFSGTGYFGGKVGISTTSPSTIGDLSVGSTGTTTIYIGSAGTKGGCIQTTNDTGTATKIYVTGTTVTAAAGYCR